MALRLLGSGSGYIELKAPASAGDNTLTLPTNNGSANQLLKTDGSGNLSWGDDVTKLPLTGGTLTGNTTINDNVFLNLGASDGSDARIWHDSTGGGHTYFFSYNNAGVLKIADDSNVVIGKVSNYNYINCTTTTVELYAGDGSTTAVKLSTQPSGTLTTGDAVIQDSVYLSNNTTISSRLVLSSSNASAWTGTRDLVALDLIGNGADHRTGTLSIKCKKASGDAAPTEMMRIDGVYNLTKIISGNLDLVDGDLKVASGHGIDFSATSDGAGSSPDELLDDYEEGTWTPSYDTSGATGAISNVTYATQVGKYVKIGKMVHIEGTLKTSAITKDTSGTYDIAGLPYPCMNSTAIGAVFCYLQSNWTNAPHNFDVVANTSRMRARQGIDVGDGTYTTGNTNDFNTGAGNNNRIYFSGQYRAQ